MLRKEVNSNQESVLFTESPHYPGYRFFPDSKKFAQWLNRTQEGITIYENGLGMEIGWLNYSNGMNFSGNEWLAARFPQEFSPYILAIDSSYFDPTKYRSDNILGNQYWSVDKPSAKPISVCGDCSDPVFSRHLHNSVDQVLLISPDLVGQMALMQAALEFTKPETGTATIILSPTNVYERLIHRKELPAETLAKVIAQSSLRFYSFQLLINGVQADRQSLLQSYPRPLSVADYLQTDFPRSHYIYLDDEQLYKKMGVYIIQARKYKH